MRAEADGHLIRPAPGSGQRNDGIPQRLLNQRQLRKPPCDAVGGPNAD